MEKKVILHVDMDAFFAAVEQRDHPEWRGKPVIVGAGPHERGVVSTCSYEARKFGVHSAMPSRTAYALCPQGIFVKPRMKVYSAVSAQVFEILEHYSPFVEGVSVDEAFLDVTGTVHLFGASPTEHVRRHTSHTSALSFSPRVRGSPKRCNVPVTSRNASSTDTPSTNGE